MKQGLLIDMDGVIYVGDEMIQGADAFIAYLLKNKREGVWSPLFNSEESNAFIFSLRYREYGLMFL